MSEELLAAIHERPADTALRLVYADALQQLGDPRGEFIALQCLRQGTTELPGSRARCWRRCGAGRRRR